MLIGITGGICSGKSRVAAYWSRCFQLELIDLDAICRELLARDQPGWMALKKSYGHRFFTSDGHLDRSGFRTALFSDKALRDEVNSILHPLAGAHMQNLYHRAKKSVVLVEVPLLFEAGWEQQFDRIVVVYATGKIRCKRIVTRDRVNRNEAEQAISIQWPLRRKIEAADHVIDNTASWFNTCLRIMHLGRLYPGVPDKDRIAASENT
ncbi:MAG TPA: dephospho-CoA kinase [Desulfobulbaceae bacterium]|nr:dephospho-CoA kinase [Desulfobulbaceae bacterium]